MHIRGKEKPERYIERAFQFQCLHHALLARLCLSWHQWHFAQSQDLTFGPLLASSNTVVAHHLQWSLPMDTTRTGHTARGHQTATKWQQYCDSKGEDHVHGEEAEGKEWHISSITGGNHNGGQHRLGSGSTIQAEWLLILPSPLRTCAHSFSFSAAGGDHLSCLHRDISHCRFLVLLHHHQLDVMLCTLEKLHIRVPRNGDYIYTQTSEIK